MPLKSATFPIASGLLLSLTLGAGPSRAQTPAAPAPVKQQKPKPYASPLDTIMSTHLWTDVPEARDFVRESRPAVKDLAYTPLTGTDPDRPKPRDAANVLALQAELEQAGARNARGLGRPAKSRHAKAKSAD